MDWGSEHSAGGGPQWTTLPGKAEPGTRPCWPWGRRFVPKAPRATRDGRSVASVFLPLFRVGSWRPAQHTQTACRPGEAVGPCVPRASTCGRPLSLVPRSWGRPLRSELGSGASLGAQTRSGVQLSAAVHPLSSAPKSRSQRLPACPLAHAASSVPWGPSQPLPSQGLWPGGPSTVPGRLQAHT